MKILCAAAFAPAVSAIGPTAAQPVRIKCGILDCDVSGDWGFIIGSQQTCSACSRRTHPGPREPYVGVISKFDLDIGDTGRGQMVLGGLC